MIIINHIYEILTNTMCLMWKRSLLRRSCDTSAIAIIWLIYPPSCLEGEDSKMPKPVRTKKKERERLRIILAADLIKPSEMYLKVDEVREKKYVEWSLSLTDWDCFNLSRHIFKNGCYSLGYMIERRCIKLFACSCLVWVIFLLFRTVP